MIQGSINQLLGMASGAISMGKGAAAQPAAQPAPQKLENPTPAAPEPAAQPAPQNPEDPTPAAPEPAAQPAPQKPEDPTPAAPEPAAQKPADPTPVSVDPAVKVAKATRSAAKALNVEQDRIRRATLNSRTQSEAASNYKGGIKAWQERQAHLSMM